MNYLAILKPAPGSKHTSKRVGRGQGSGNAGTSTRGHKGAQSRSGYSVKVGFEGGQMPLQRRIPKFGFKNRSRKEYKVLNLDVLETLSNDHDLHNIDLSTLLNLRVVRKKEKVKVLGRGKITKPLNISLHGCSKAAIAAIKEAGGSVSFI